MRLKRRQKSPAQTPTEVKPAASTVSFVRFAFIGLVVAALWTLVGVGVAAIEGHTLAFLKEWYLLQGGPLTGIGATLLALARSRTLEDRVARVTANGELPFQPLIGSRREVLISGSIGIIGTASLIGLGFNAHVATRAFMWLTAACVCYTAGAVTVHAIDILRAVNALEEVDIRVHCYAPARTPELKSLVSYFSWFTLLMTVGYAAALIATLNPNWTGSRSYIDAVRWFWPILYVPTCSLALIYPHIVVHRMIQREKEATLVSCQEDIDTLLKRYGQLNKEDIDKTNSLTQLFDRISATPNYVIDFGIAVRTFLPLAFNILTLFAKSAFHLQ